MRQYATAEQFAAYPGGDAVDPALADGLLQQASRTVDLLLVGVAYDVDGDSLPTDPTVADVLATATCAQAVLLSRQPAGATAGTQWGNVKIGSLALADKSSTSGVSIDGVPVAADCLAALRLLGQPTIGRW